MKSGVRNHFAGTIVEIVRDEEVSEVEIETDAGILTAVMCNRVAEAPGLRVGDPAVTSVRASDVFVHKLDQAA